MTQHKEEQFYLYPLMAHLLSFINTWSKNRLKEVLFTIKGLDIFSIASKMHRAAVLKVAWDRTFSCLALTLICTWKISILSVTMVNSELRRHVFYVPRLHWWYNQYILMTEKNAVTGSSSRKEEYILSTTKFTLGLSASCMCLLHK